jgi:hypothetical protein
MTTLTKGVQREGDHDGTWMSRPITVLKVRRGRIGTEIAICEEKLVKVRESGCADGQRRRVEDLGETVA